MVSNALVLYIWKITTQNTFFFLNGVPQAKAHCVDMLPGQSNVYLVIIFDRPKNVCALQEMFIENLLYFRN